MASKKKKVTSKVSKKKIQKAQVSKKKVSSKKVGSLSNSRESFSSASFDNKTELLHNVKERSGPFTTKRIVAILLLALLIILLAVWSVIKDPKEFFKLSSPIPDEKPPETILVATLVNSLTVESQSVGQASLQERKAKALDPIPVEAGAEYTVLKGDTFKKIAKKTLGDKRRAREIMNFNKMSSPDELEVGKTIRIPVK